MIKIGLIYMLLLVSLFVPPLLFVSIPLAIWWANGVRKRRRALIDYTQAVKAQKVTDDVVRYFR